MVSRLLQSNRAWPAERSRRGPYGDSSSDSDDDLNDSSAALGTPRLSPTPQRPRGRPPISQAAAPPAEDLDELRTLAERGDAAAQAALGTVLWSSDQPEALRYLTLAADQGHAAGNHPHPHAHFNCLFLGTFLTGRSLLVRAPDPQHPTGSARSLNPSRT